jgi:hypothetical protein
MVCAVSTILRLAWAGAQGSPGVRPRWPGPPQGGTLAAPLDQWLTQFFCENILGPSHLRAA